MPRYLSISLNTKSMLRIWENKIPYGLPSEIWNCMEIETQEPRPLFRSFKVKDLDNEKQDK